MKILVLVKPNSKIESFEQTEDGSYKARVNAQPVDGRANERTIELISKYFNIPKSLVTLVSGEKSKKKLFTIQSKIDKFQA